MSTYNDENNQSNAQMWYDLFTEIRKMEEGIRSQQRVLEGLKTKQYDLTGIMERQVNSTQSMVVYDVGGGNLLIIEHKRGLRIQRVQPKPEPPQEKE